jgi:hypothetical protein
MILESLNRQPSAASLGVRKFWPTASQLPIVHYSVNNEHFLAQVNTELLSKWKALSSLESWNPHPDFELACLHKLKKLNKTVVDDEGGHHLAGL